MSSDEHSSIPKQGWCIIGGRAYFVAEVSSFVVQPSRQAERAWEERRASYYARKPKSRWIKPRIIEPSRMQRWREAKLRQWEALVPGNIAASQVKREMWLAISRAHRAGASQKDLAAWLGVSRGRISQGILGIEWSSERLAIPVDRYTTFTRGELHDLARALKVKPQRTEWPDECSWAHGVG